ncbi:MAG: histidinol-phosphate aminotransferase family protein [Saprospiraceae bacterium]|nr:histidinol-phosphate aminotransferase family protein [Saprospiraceae bacterium]
MKNHPTTRRAWLQQSAMAFAGLSVMPNWWNEAPLLDFSNENDKPISLGSNENPYAPSPVALKAMQDAAKRSNRYPWTVTTQLREAIAQKNKLSTDHVVIGAGSSEILGLTAQWAALQNGNAIAADPTFGIWMRAAENLGLKIIKVPLTTDKIHDLPKMLSAINADTKLVYICNPNNPTGTILPAQQLKDFVMEVSKTRIVLLDEAYLEFTDEPSVASLVTGNRNLIVAKTFSKIYGLAGARIGYGLAHPDTIKALVGLQPWANHSGSAVSLAAAMASLNDAEFISYSRKEINKTKDFVYQEFKKLNIPYIPSHTNFLYYSLAAYKGADWRKALADNNINAGSIVEQNGKWARISVGTMEEMQYFMKTVQTIL